MVVLALETVTRAGSIALWDHGVCHAMVGDGTRTHGERLPGELVNWLARHGRSLSDVDVLAVVSGPGSFTGIRIGMAAMQGLALAGHRRVVGVPTLHALASTWTLAHAEPALVVPCVDAQRGQVFLAGLQFDGTAAIEDCPEIIAPASCLPDEAVALIAAHAGAGQPVVMLGDGVTRYRDVWAARLPSVRLVEAPATLAEAAARLAARRPDLAGAPHALRPLYVRRPDAVMARERAAQQAGGPNAAGLTVRLASGADDLKAVEALQRMTFTNPWGADAIRWELEHTDVARLYVAHEPGGTLVAYCACWVVFDELHINSFAVDPTWRRRGIARQVLRHVCADAANAGATSATLEVRASNVPARQLYEGLGFRVEATRRDYYQDPREDALILWHRALAMCRNSGTLKADPAR